METVSKRRCENPQDRGCQQELTELALQRSQRVGTAHGGSRYGPAWDT